MESEVHVGSQITKVVSMVEGSTGADTEHTDVNEEDSRNNRNFSDEEHLKDLRNYESFDAENDTEILLGEKYEEIWNMPERPGNLHHMHVETTCENDIDSDVNLKFVNYCPTNTGNETVDGAVKFEKNAQILQIADHRLLEANEISALEDLGTENCSTELNRRRSHDEEGMDRCEKMEGKRHDGELQTVKLTEGEHDSKQSHENTDPTPDIVTVPESPSLSDIRNGTDFEPLSTEEIGENDAASIDHMPELGNNEDSKAENEEVARFLDNNTDDIIRFVASTTGIHVSVSDLSLIPEACAVDSKDPDIASEKTPKTKPLEQDIHLALKQGEDTNGILISDELQGVLLEPSSAVENPPSGNKACKGQSSKACEEQGLTFSYQEIPAAELPTEAGSMPDVIEQHPIERQEFSCDGQSVVHSAIEIVEHPGSTTKEEDWITFPDQEISETGLTDEAIEDYPIDNQEISSGEQPIDEPPPNVEIPEVGLTDGDFEVLPIEKQTFSLGEQLDCEQKNDPHSDEVEPPSAGKENATSATEVQIGNGEVKDLDNVPECVSSNKHMVDDDDQTRVGIEKAECMQRGTANDENISLKADDRTIEDRFQASEKSSSLQSGEGNQVIQENKDEACLESLRFKQGQSSSNASETQNPAGSVRRRRHVNQGPPKDVTDHHDEEQPLSIPNDEGERCCSFMGWLFGYRCCRLLCWLFGYRC